MRLVFFIFIFCWLNPSLLFANPNTKNLVEPLKKTNPVQAEKVLQPQNVEVKLNQNSYVEKINNGFKKTIAIGKKGFSQINSIQMLTAQRRAKRPHNIMASYTGVATWIPSKIGLSYTYSPTAIGSWELSYSRGKISAPFFISDIGTVSDSHLSLLYRSYSRRNTFAVIYGLNYYKFDAHLSSEFLSSISSGPVSDYNILAVESLGATIGFGNRWQLKNGMSLGVDWFQLNIPLHVFKTEANYLSSNADPEDKKDIENVLDILKRVPTFSFLKLQAGYTF